MKKMWALVLVISILFGMVSTVAGAQQEPLPVNTQSVQVEGSNDLGAMLADPLSHQAEEQKQAEDGMRMLSSGKAQALAEERTAVVTFSGEMPESFQVSAYLLDAENYEPLSPAYETPMYTKEMQELVWNLDENTTTNFVVLKEKTVYVRSEAGVNTVLQADREQGIYRIGNADEQFTGLQPGDVVFYPCEDGQVLAFKAEAVTTESDGSVTIQTTAVELEDVFSHVKIEGSGTSDDATVDADFSQ